MVHCTIWFVLEYKLNRFDLATNWIVRSAIRPSLKVTWCESTGSLLQPFPAELSPFQNFKFNRVDLNVVNVVLANVGHRLDQKRCRRCWRRHGLAQGVNEGRHPTDALPNLLPTVAWKSDQREDFGKKPFSEQKFEHLIQARARIVSSEICFPTPRTNLTHKTVYACKKSDNRISRHSQLFSNCLKCQLVLCFPFSDI